MVPVVNALSEGTFGDSLPHDMCLAAHGDTGLSHLPVRLSPLTRRFMTP
jgi:hypothetical protein